MVFTANSLDPGETFTAAYDMTSSTGVRYPGGCVTEKYFDVRNPEKSISADGKAMVPISQFMEWCIETGASPSIVIPTSRLIDSTTGTLDQNGVTDIQNFVRYIIEKFPEVAISQFEIGNEYWGDDVSITSAQYGVVVNSVAPAIQQVLDELLGRDSVQPAIAAQMGEPWGPEFDSPGSGSLRWLDRIEQANLDIIEQLGSEARAALDALVDHYYMRDDSGLDAQNNFFWNLPNASVHSIANTTNYLERISQYWLDAGFDLDLSFTEWGISSELASQFGLRGAGVLMEQFEMMLSLGVDSAYAWPLQLNSPVDLAGSQNRTPALTPLGAAFELMADALPGTRLLQSQITGGALEVNGFGSDSKFVFFVMSRSDLTQTFRLDLRDTVTVFREVQGVRLSLDDTSSNGIHYVDGSWLETARFNEQDTRALLLDMPDIDLRGGANLSLTLNPYEIIRLEYSLYAPVNIAGTDGKDVLRGGNGNDLLNGLNGRDRLIGGKGDDTLYGGNGNDVLSGWGGNDQLFGGRGEDRLYGNEGHDIIEGGLASDRLFGAAGRDIFVFRDGDGRDHIGDFEPGNDRIEIHSRRVDSFDDLILRTDQVLGSDSFSIDYGGGVIFIDGLSADQISADDFIFL
jgi:hypothetical protein